MTTQQTGRALARKLARTVSEPFTARLWPRVEAIAAAHAKQASERSDELHQELVGRIDGATTDIDRAHGRIDEVVGWHTDLGEEFDKLRDRVGKLEHELSRVAAQLAAVDSRLALAERAPVVVGGAESDPARLTEATTLVDEIRTEHRRMAARLTALASYEERIGRLEEHLT